MSRSRVALDEGVTEPEVVGEGMILAGDPNCTSGVGHCFTVGAQMRPNALSLLHF